MKNKLQNNRLKINRDATDWDSYYQNPSYLSKFTRPITSRLLFEVIKKYNVKPNPSIIEIGGGNSCFADQMVEDVKPSSYTIIDNNEFAVNQFLDRYKEDDKMLAHCENILAPKTSVKADIVYSVGLVEHFFEDETKKAIKNHFDFIGEEGLVIISFPTPTILYRIIRFFAEKAEIWAFPDERPLGFAEVLDACKGQGEVVAKFVNWKIGLTQGVVVLKK